MIDGQFFPGQALQFGAGTLTPGKGGGDLPVPAGHTVLIDEQFASLDFETWVPVTYSTGISGDGGTAVANEYAMYADPRYEGWNGYSPFELVEDGLHIEARLISEIDPAPDAGTVLTDSKTSADFEWVGGILSAPSIAFRSGIIDTFISGAIADPAAWIGGYFKPVGLASGGSGRPEIDNPEIVFFDDADGRCNQNLIRLSGGSPQSVTGVDFTSGSHWFRTEVTDFAINFYHAGVLTYTIDISDKPDAQDEFFPILSMTVGSNMGGWVPPPDGETVSPLGVTYERIRIAVPHGPNSLALSNTTVLSTDTLMGVLSHTSAGTSTGGTYSLDDDSGGEFEIVGDELHASAMLSPGEHTLVARVTDDQGKFWRRQFGVEVLADSLGTNLWSNESDFTNAAWSKFDVTVVTGGEYQRIQETATVQRHALSRTYTKAASEISYVVAMDVKYDGSIEWVRLDMANNFSGESAVSFNIKDGYVGAVHYQAGDIVLDSYAIQGIGGGVYRLRMGITVPASITNLRMQLKLLLVDEENATRLGDTDNGILVRKAQLVQV